MNKIVSSKWSYKNNRTKVTVYTYENPSIIKMLDEWFENNIRGLKYKSSVWSRLGSKVTNMIGKEIAQLLKLSDDYSVTWSRTAGCSCGCSPGWIVKQNGKNVHSIKLDGQYVNVISVNIDTTGYESEVAKLIEVAASLLPAEIAKNG